MPIAPAPHVWNPISIPGVQGNVRSFRWGIPALILGGWAAVLAHRYLASLSGTLHAWRPDGLFVLSTSVAIGVAVLLVTRLILHQPDPRVPPARVPSWIPHLGFRTMGVFAIVSMLVQVERAERHLPPPPPEVSEVSSMAEPPDLEPATEMPPNRGDLSFAR